MIIALTVVYDDGDFGVHYAAAKTLAQAQQWCESRKSTLKKQGLQCSSAVLNTDHIQWVDECNVDEPGVAGG
jgi:hypothetical protein